MTGPANRAISPSPWRLCPALLNANILLGALPSMFRDANFTFQQAKPEPWMCSLGWSVIDVLTLLKRRDYLSQVADRWGSPKNLCKASGTDSSYVQNVAKQKIFNMILVPHIHKNQPHTMHTYIYIYNHIFNAPKKKKPFANHSCVDIYMHICAYIYMYTYMFIRISVYMHTNNHTYIYIYVH